jgi:Family of unknown function (DUF6326)
MPDIKERLSLLWLFALLNYLYADVIALWAMAGHAVVLPPWALTASAVLMEIPIAMILFSRMMPFWLNKLSNIVFGLAVTIINGFLTYAPPLLGWGKPPAFEDYLFFATIETVATLAIVWQALVWTRKKSVLHADLVYGDPSLMA